MAQEALPETMAEFDGVIFSDMHLSPDTPRQNELFEAFVEKVAGTPCVACLGDTTEYWLGRVQLREPHGARVVAALTRLGRAARQAIFVPGNRDFVMPPQARQAGFSCYRNRYEGDFAGRRVAFEHGDRFCTNDRQYQRFRAWFRRLPWRLIQLLLTARQGHRLCTYMRGKSRKSTSTKDPNSFLMQDAPVQRLFRRGAEVVVAGHVHFPFRRTYDAAGRAGELFVLGDWREDGAVVCVVKSGEFSLRFFSGDGFEEFDAPGEQMPAYARVSSYGLGKQRV